MSKRATRSKGKNPKAAPIQGIGEAAAALGVNRDHLRFVLQGKRTSKRLLARYQAYVAQKESPSPMNQEYSPAFKAELLASLDKLERKYNAMSTLLDLGSKRLKETLESARQCSQVLKSMRDAAAPLQAAAPTGELTCQKCKGAPATVHLTQVESGSMAGKIDLCETCANSEGVNGSQGFSFANLAARIAAKD